MPDDAPTCPRSLARGLAVLEAITAAPGGLSFSALTDHLGLADTALARVTRPLLAMGYLAKDPGTGYYVPGDRSRRLGGGDDRAACLHRVGLPLLANLVARFGNTGLLILCAGPRSTCLDRIVPEDAMALQLPGYVADEPRRPPWGWFYGDDDWWRAQPARVADGPTRAEILRERARWRRHGFLVRRQPDRVRLAAAIQPEGGPIIGALALGDAPTRLPESRVMRRGRDLATAAVMASRALAPIA